MEDEKKTISVSSKLYDVILRRVENSDDEFSSPDEYVDYILTELFEEKSDTYTKEEQEEIQKKLRDMGYI